MKTNRIAVALLLITIILFTAACSNEDTPADACPPSVLWNDTVYYSFKAAELSEETVTEDMVVGKIASVVGIEGMPQNNGEANFPAAENAEIAEYEGELYIHYPNGYWYQLTPKDAAEAQ